MRTVFCRKYQKELPGLAMPPLPGVLGQTIFDEISDQAWKEWQSNQTMLINEHRLNLMDPNARQWLTSEMERFFSNQVYAKPAGFIPTGGGNTASGS